MEPMIVSGFSLHMHTESHAHCVIPVHSLCISCPWEQKKLYSFTVHSRVLEKSMFEALTSYFGGVEKLCRVMKTRYMVRWILRTACNILYLGTIP
jgi:hypothetical protein